MTWILVMLGTFGAVILAADFATDKECLEAATEHQKVMAQKAGAVPLMYCVSIIEDTIPPMEIPGKHI